MKKNHAVLIVMLICFIPVALCEDEIVPNLGFENQSAGTAVSLPGPDGGIDTATISDWRVYNVAEAPTVDSKPPAADSFSVTVVEHASAGKNAVRLDLDNKSKSAENWGLDRISSMLPVSYGKIYQLHFDAAHLSGSPYLKVAITEYDSGGQYLNETSIFDFTVEDADYETFSTRLWTPNNSATSQINILFRPRAADNTDSSCLLDNIRLEEAK